MKKAITRTISLITLVFIGLTGCADNTSREENTGSTITADINPEPSHSQSDETRSLEIEKPFEISQLADNDVFLTIKEVKVGGECSFGMYSPEFPNDDLGNELTYLQVLAEVDVQQLDNPQSQGQVYLSAPKTVDADGFTKEAELALDCQPGNGYEDWFLPTESQEKTRRYGAFVVPSSITEVEIEGKKYAVTTASTGI